MEHGCKHCRMALLAGSFLLLMVTAGAAHGVIADDLYEAVVPVDGTGGEARDKAFREALRQVLLRLTGDPDQVRKLVPPDSDKESESGEDEKDASLGEGAARFIDAFSYRREDDKLELHATLSASALGRQLAEREVPVWGANRPRVLVWFVVDDRGDRQLIHRENTLPPFLDKSMQPLDGSAIAAERGPWKEPLWAGSRRRGLPIALPFYDEKDRSVVSISELWGLFPEPIREASERYEHDRMAVVRVDRLGGGWRARWHLWRDGDMVADGVTREDERDRVVSSLVDAWADRLAQDYVVTPGTGDKLRPARMLVSGVGSLESYAAVRRSLSGLEPIRSARVNGLNQDYLGLTLAFNGDLPLLRDYLALEKRLEPMGGPPDGAIPTDPDHSEPMLYYRWKGSNEPTGAHGDEGESLEIVPLEESPEQEPEGDVTPLL